MADGAPIGVTVMVEACGDRLQGPTLRAAMGSMAKRLPIIYVRGFGGGQGGIDKAADDPFYGFNEGSTHIRVGERGMPRFYQFEGPMLRLMLEEDYKIRVGGSQQEELLNAKELSIAPDSVWVYRFYDKSAGTFGAEPEPYNIAEAAKGLAEYIDLVRNKTQGKPMVNLVAHSMGGLICRTALQREIENPQDVVSKLCTIGAPHGGIDPKLGGGVGDWVMKTFGPNGSDIFQPDVMRGYMLPDGYDDSNDPKRDGKWDPRVMVGGFKPERVLSIVGTNAHDYELALGTSALAMGEQSDGLVAIRNAYVRASPRAYVHRSHSGRYGLVNSEEVYQNLKRFLLGSLRVQIEIDGLDPQKLKGRIWQADTWLAIRKLPVLIHEQTADHFCPVDLNAEAKDQAGPTSPIPLITMFLAPGQLMTCRYALSLNVTSLKEESGWFGFHDHLEKIADWEDSLVLDLQIVPKGQPNEGNVTGGTCAWNSTIEGRIAETDLMPNDVGWTMDAAGVWRGEVPLPQTALALLGKDAKLKFAASLWD